MEGNDLGPTVHRHVACMFEGLIMVQPPEPERKTRFLDRFRRDEAPVQELEDDEYVRRVMRTWRVNEMPMKSLIHMTTKLGIACEVYTFLDPMFGDAIEHWLARKGASCTVWCYFDIDDLRDDFKYNRDVHTFFTTNEEHAAILGPRTTVVKPDGTFGF